MYITEKYSHDMGGLVETEKDLGVSSHHSKIVLDFFQPYNGDSCCGIFKTVGVFYISIFLLQHVHGITLHRGMIKYQLSECRNRCIETWELYF